MLLSVFSGRRRSDTKRSAFLRGLHMEREREQRENILQLNVKGLLGKSDLTDPLHTNTHTPTVLLCEKYWYDRRRQREWGLKRPERQY